MKNPPFLVFIFIFIIHLKCFAQTTIVSSQSEFDNALDRANTGDIIEWTDGTYSDIVMKINVPGITVQAVNIGEVIFNGSSSVEINADAVTFSGLQYIGGDIGTNHIVKINGSNVIFDNINIAEYTSYKYLIVEEKSQYTTIKNCNFEHRVNNPNQNILSILVNEDQPGFHSVQYCSFKNFDGEPNNGSVGDAGVEPIRIGVSSSASYESKSIVEYCYFTQCNGDAEIISHKATECIYRYNTFDDNPEGELVLRHGDKGIVYGNFFTNNWGGVRIREGSDHVVYNNYFSGLTGVSLNLQASSSDRLDNILIAYNTFIESAPVIIENDLSDEATNVTIANNIFATLSSTNTLFLDQTGDETWIGNIAFGELGGAEINNFNVVDPDFSLNTKGYYTIGPNSRVIDQGVAGYSAIPEFTGLNYDNEIALDILGTSRPDNDNLKDVGCQEYDAQAIIEPYVDGDNTGPIYLRPDTPLGVDDFITTLENDVNIYPNPLTGSDVNINFNLTLKAAVEITLFDITGKEIAVVLKEALNSGVQTVSSNVDNIAAGIYILEVKANDNTKTEKFIKL